jgi:hypothetical protein
MLCVSRGPPKVSPQPLYPWPCHVIEHTIALDFELILVFGGALCDHVKHGQNPLQKACILTRLAWMERCLIACISLWKIPL